MTGVGVSVALERYVLPWLPHQVRWRVEVFALVRHRPSDDFGTSNRIFEARPPVRLACMGDLALIPPLAPDGPPSHDPKALGLLSGMDLVVCHHATVLMGMERQGTGMIPHGLENFMFGFFRRRVHSWRNLGIVAEAIFSTEGLVSVCLHPVEVAADRSLRLLHGQHRLALLGGVARASQRLEDCRFLAVIQ